MNTMIINPTILQHQPPSPSNKSDSSFDWQTTLKVILIVVGIVAGIGVLFFLSLKFALPVISLIIAAIAGAYCCRCGKDSKTIDQIGREKMHKAKHFFENVNKSHFMGSMMTTLGKAFGRNPHRSASVIPHQTSQTNPGGEQHWGERDIRKVRSFDSIASHQNVGNQSWGERKTNNT